MRVQLLAWWSRVRDRLARLFRRARTEPGHYEQGTRGSLTGWVGVAPWVLPRREYLVYVPRGHGGWRRGPMIVLLHGCKQSPEEIAQGTRIAALADRMGAVVLLPRQHPRANAWGCWNWFDRATSSGRGEAAIVAAQIRSVRRRYRVHRRRVFLAGMSSGAALAAIVALHRPHLVAGAFLHSGLPAGAASSPLAASEVMQRGPDVDVAALARALRDAHGRAIPLMVVHGGADTVVGMRNAEALVEQFLALTPDPERQAGPQDTTDEEIAPARRLRVQEWRREGRLVVRLAVVEGLGHAWSGGDDTMPFNDAAPPDATALLEAFIADTSAPKPRGTWPWRSRA
jgi:poly(hydroxyalkanoate) depolymerase family esterase